MLSWSGAVMTSDSNVLSTEKGLLLARSSSRSFLTEARLPCLSNSYCSSWTWLTTLYVMCGILCIIFHSTSAGDIPEFCQFENFEASCNSDEVIMMEVARYGRMKVGRCVKKNYGDPECSINVLPLLDRLCSGRRRCVQAVTDPNFTAGQEVCNSDLKNYLEAKYSCVKVVQSAPHQCMNSGHVVIPSSPGYLSSTVTHETQCGSPDTPYLIRLNKGQQLNVTLIDFNTTLPTGRGSRGNALSSHGMIRGNPGNRHHSGSACQRYVSIHEPLSGRKENYCSQGMRVANLFTSDTHVVEIAIWRISEINLNTFLLYYEAIGCPDLDPQPDMWFERTNGIMNVGCNTSTTAPQWQLRCKGSNWIGSLGNCSREASNYGELTHHSISLSTGLLIAIVIGIAISISIVILCLGVSLLRRKTHHRRQQMKQNNLMDMLDDPQLRVPDAYMRDDCNLYEQRHASLYCATSTDNTCNANDLGYLWDSNAGGPARVHSAVTGTIRGRGSKPSEKLYATATYAPVPCKCPPIKLKEIRTTTCTSGCTLATPRTANTVPTRQSVESSSNVKVFSPSGPQLQSAGIAGVPPRVNYYEYDTFDPDVIRANTINAKKSRVLPSNGVTESLCRSHDSGIVTNGSSENNERATSN